MKLLPVSKAKELAKEYNCKRVIVFFCNDEDRAGYTSYGKNKAVCKDTKFKADCMLETLQDLIEEDSMFF